MALVSLPPLGSRHEVVASHLVAALVLVGSVTSAYFGAAVASPLRNALLSSDLDGVRDQLLLFAVLTCFVGALVAVLVRARFPGDRRRVCALWGPIGALVAVGLLTVVLGGLLVVLQPVSQGLQTPLQAAAAAVFLWVPLASFATFLLGLSWALIDRGASASSLTSLVVLAAGTAAPGAAAIALVSLSI
ncbi:hypothetical protein [Frigoribacterium sp. CFBP 8751]|uniref:hypothetical protein n=1 Tax=Frigoribacterium sp. CFBP 8751 TaxID=2775277 RepID=UPI00177B7AB2|nr:hypothetical protein [Frigoribacterium sp. CFBP 8751]MBD8539195.1 hypothetical protein [Frigoribacterium sp. CFBP 8751]